MLNRNEALYKTTSTTPAPTAPPAVIIRRVVVGEDGRPLRRPGAGRFRRPQANRRPVYYDDYYDEYQDYYDVPGNEEEGGSKNATENAANTDTLLEVSWVVVSPIRNYDRTVFFFLKRET